MSQTRDRSPTRHTVLVVDDCAVVRRMLVLRLRQAGFEVAEAATGEEALTRLRREPADVVLTDVSMPGRGGLHLLAELRRELPHIEVILLTGAQTDCAEAAKQARRLGVHDYIPKGPAALEAAVLATASAVERRRLRAEAKSRADGPAPAAPWNVPDRAP